MWHWLSHLFLEGIVCRKRSRMLISEQIQLLFAEEKRKQNGQIYASLNNSADIQLILKIFNRFLLETHATHLLAEAFAEA